MLRAVARCGSLSAAARDLGYTQPAVSHHIARLEAEVGTALLTRLGRGVRLTDAGLALVEHADAVLSRLEADPHLCFELWRGTLHRGLTPPPPPPGRPPPKGSSFSHSGPPAPPP